MSNPLEVSPDLQPITQQLFPLEPREPSPLETLPNEAATAVDATALTNYEFGPEAVETKQPEPTSAAYCRPLIIEAKAGDMGALGRAWQRSLPVARAAVLKIAKLNDSNLEEILGETARKVTEKLETFDEQAPDASFPAWAKSIAQRTTLDMLKSHHHTRSIPVSMSVGGMDYDEKKPLGGIEDFEKKDPLFPTNIPTPEAVAEMREANERVLNILALLPTSQREAVIKTRLQGITIDEFAAEKGISHGAAKAIAMRGIARLRALAREGVLTRDPEDHIVNISIPEPEPVPADPAVTEKVRAAAERRAASAQVLGRLTGRAQEVIQAIDIDGLSLQDYAEQAGLSVGYVRNALTLGRKQVRELLAGETAA